MPYTTQRPVAWSPGVMDGECETSRRDQQVWTVGAMQGQHGSVVVTVLDGDNGDILDEVAIPEMSVGGFGPYGSAFDAEGDFWFIDSGNDGPGQELVRVRGDDRSYEIFRTPDGTYAYGFTIDSQGRPWVAESGGTQVMRFDPDTETWKISSATAGIGLQDDGRGRMWVVHYPYDWRGVMALDLETLEEVDRIEIKYGQAEYPSSLNPRGLSLDYFGNIMVVGNSTVHRINPDTREIRAFEGLNSAYTYSDMTGWGLRNVVFPNPG